MSMSNGTTAWIGTRKGLFPVYVDGGTPSIGSPTFLGSPVTNAVRDPRDGAVYASLDHGHFGVHLHRSDDGGETWVEIAAPEYPPKPEGEQHVNPMSQKRGRVGDAARMDARAGPSRRAGRAVVRHDSRWPVPIGRSGRLVAVGRCACGTCRRGPSGSVAATTMPACIRSASTRDRPGHLVVGVSCGGAWRTEDGGKSWQVAAHGMRANFLPPELDGRSRHPGPAPPLAVRRPARRALVPAPLRDLPHHRQRRQVGRDRAGRARRRSGSPSPPILTIR